MSKTPVHNLMNNISDGKAVLVQLAVWVGVVQDGPLLRDTLCGLLCTQPYSSQCGKVGTSPFVPSFTILVPAVHFTTD